MCIAISFGLLGFLFFFWGTGVKSRALTENFAAVTFSEEETVNAVPTHLKSMTVRNSHLYYLTPHLNGQWCGHRYSPQFGMFHSI